MKIDPVELQALASEHGLFVDQSDESTFTFYSQTGKQLAHILHDGWQHLGLIDAEEGYTVRAELENLREFVEQVSKRK